MTVATPQYTVTFNADGVTTVFPFSFPIPALGNLVVTTNTSGTVAVLPQNSYRVSGIGNPSGGTVTYPLTGSPLASPVQLIITRQIPNVQATSLVNQDGYYPKVVEAAMDALAMQIQQGGIQGVGNYFALFTSVTGIMYGTGTLIEGLVIGPGLQLIGNTLSVFNTATGNNLNTIDVNANTALADAQNAINQATIAIANATSAINTANNAITQANAAIAALPSKLNNSAADVLNGTITFGSYGAFSIGNVVWTPPSSGGGTGTATGTGGLFNEKGIVYVNAGAIEMVLDAVHGTAVFAGALSAASGTFSGTLVAANGTFTGTLSSVNGTFTGSLVAASGTFTGSLSGVNGTFIGTLVAATGTFTGQLTSGASVTGNLQVMTSGAISSGQTAYNTGTGYWMEYNGGVPRLSIGNSTNGVTWNGSTFTINGALVLTNNLVPYAVTVPTAAYTAGPVSPTGGSYQTIQSLSWTSSGAQTIVMVTFAAGYWTATGSLYIKCLDDLGNSLVTTDFISLAYENYAVTFAYTPTAGVRTMYLQVNAFATGPFINISLVTLEAKR